MSQTTVQRADAVRFGSAKVEVGDNIGALINLGSLRSVKVVESWEESKIESDNAGVLRQRIRNQKAVITAEWMEPDLTAIEEIRGGIDTYSTQAGVLVNNHQQLVASGDWNYLKFIPFDKQNGAGTCPNIDSVTGSTDGLLVVDTDYFAVKDETGVWGIYIKDTATVTTEAQSITIQIDYTPNASKTLSTGGKFTIGAKVVRLTNTNEDSETFVMTFYRAFITQGLELPWPGDNGEDAMPVPFSMTAELDTTRTAGDQLYAAVDGQSIT